MTGLDIENRCLKARNRKAVFMVAGVIHNGRYSNNSVCICIFWSVAPFRERMRKTFS